LNLPEELDLVDYKIIEGEQALKVAQDWLSIFCSHRTSFKGIRGGKSYVWDEIHSKHQNTDAIIEYEKHFASSYFLMPDNFGEFEKQIYVSRTKPIGNPKLSDFHVFPKNLAWSIAFTHEDGWIGPKFFRHSKYSQLNKINEKSMHELSRIHV